MIKAKIKSISAYESLTSSGKVSLEIKVFADDQSSASVCYPFDNSDAPFSAKDLKDNDLKRFKGFGRLGSIKNVVEKVSPALSGLSIFSQKEIDKKLKDLDAKNGQELGPAIIFSVSLACAKLASLKINKDLFEYVRELGEFEKIDVKKLPLPIFNIFNGGDTGDTNLDFQEFLLIPKREEIKDCVQKGSEVFLELAEVLRESGLDTDTGQEGGYAPEIDSSIEAIELMLSAIIRSGYKPGLDFKLGIDIGSSILYNRIEGKYLFSFDRSYFSALDMKSLYEEWFSRYPIYYLEDAFSELDWDSWQEFNKNFGDKLLVVADDMLSSNINRLRESVNKKAFNSVVLKPSKTGTLTDLIEYVKLVKQHNYKLIMSGLNNESNDSYLSDLAVAFSANYLKAGSLSRGERVVKYNRLLEIERKLILKK